MYTAFSRGAALKTVNRKRALTDALELPAYTVSEAAHYLLMPLATLRSWVLGRTYPTKGGKRRFAPLIELPDPHSGILSFRNLAEAHVLEVLRRQHGVQMDAVRRAIRFMKQRFRDSHLLINPKMETDGIHLFVDHYSGVLENVSQEGQFAIREALEASLKRLDWDSRGPIRLYPFTRGRSLDEPRMVVIDPTVSFGRPVLVGTGIPTSIIAERYKAGDSIEALAEDYGRSPLEIEEAIRCELERIAA